MQQWDLGQGRVAVGPRAGKCSRWGLGQGSAAVGARAGKCGGGASGREVRQWGLGQGSGASGREVRQWGLRQGSAAVGPRAGKCGSGASVKGIPKDNSTISVVVLPCVESFKLAAAAIMDASSSFSHHPSRRASEAAPTSRKTKPKRAHTFSKAEIDATPKMVTKFDKPYIDR